MYSKTTFFAVLSTVTASSLTADNRDLTVAFEPRFPCNRACKERIQRIFHLALLTQKPSANSVIESPLDLGLARSHRGYGTPPLCVPRTQRINWKTFVEQEICPTIRKNMPECQYRRDQCVKCFGNGSYSTYWIISVYTTAKINWS